MKTRTAIVRWTLVLVVGIVAVSLLVVALGEPAEPAVLAALLLALPLVFLLGTLRTRPTRGAGTRLLMDVPAEPTTAEAESGLRRALGDPTLRLALWLPEAESYVDADGRPLEPPPDSAGSITTRIEYEGRPLALMTHDPALLQRPAVLEEVLTAARLALEKDRSLRALRTSEARTRALLDAIPDLMFRISADGTYLDYKSRDVRDLISPAVLGRRVWDRLPPELAEQVMELARAALAGGGVQTLEYEVEIAGELRNYEGRIVSSGEYEFLMIVREITARKRAEEELRHERDLMRTVVDTAPALLLGVDADGRILRFNRALERLSGRKDGGQEDVRRRPFWQVFVAPRDAAEVERCFRAGVEERSEAEQEHSWLAASGEAIVSWSQSWYPGEGGADRWLITGRDVTERHRHRAELERERNFLNAIANNAPSLLCLIDETGRVQDRASNVTFERVLEYDPADTGGHVFWERYVPPEERDDVRTSVERVVAGGAPYEHDNSWLTRTGERLLIAWSCTPLPRIDERTLFVISGTDVTERRRQEEEIRRSRARIVEAGDAERRRLERNLHDGAQQRLVAISISLRLAKARMRESPREAEPLFEAAADELALALEELRELARGIHPAVLTDRGLEPALVALASRSPVPVTLDVQAARMPPPVEAAAYYVVSEALANVAKYAGATSVSVRVERVDGRVLVDVRDDGVGGADPERGSGLRGLSDRVSALDGLLRVESPAGAGTVIRAEIPTA